jgi:hypothetical protein
MRRGAVWKTGTVYRLAGLFLEQASPPSFWSSIIGGIMTETEAEFMPGHPETIEPEQGDVEPDENSEPGEQEG